ncbi:3-hydroxyacyl-CoA dehydrogenase NAD-binding domain-containing protein [Facklamia sp. P12955]|uniref:3-hydroxyacyl-CoA dehydrogenase NAD-binding domain-containing protein n=1 Tax=Facklamia sp. P12955 TaxID=3421946 RepID=UPI003D17946B
MDKKITVIAGGVIGSSFPIVFAIGGYNVVSYNKWEEEEEKVKKYIDNALNTLVTQNVFTSEEKDSILSRISYTGNIEEALEDVYYVQECLPEKYEIKQEFIKEFEKYAPDEAVMGSSTSGLLISEIAKYAEKPERIIGAHPYNPPHLIPLIELAKGEKSSDEAIKIAKEIFESSNKEPIVLNKELKGFVSNRIQAAVFRELISMVLDGAVSMEDADKAVTFGPGIRWGIMGPGLVFELGGGEGGIEAVLKHIGPSLESWLEDLATWTEIPEEAKEKIPKMVAESLKNRPKEIGNDRESLLKYRDEMLLDILKLHDKF